ncbi:helix-turn-helix domain-containing protein [Aureibacter tunicatorum]|uniref:AraC-like DNA-binding protein n=1 Tax=Aureibacter tunicatorum TaxID=866807 RepID=A0AAE4BRR0_9BACT|nr:AraC family transcriptional regulator [Aureibacter tunicatorum]MDR6238931.1 AraC-like DNA-binding protein [Aureibacter tunicatorum]BDD05143.1 hypothetical protein AUTU_26260 [Aureibacter tunicatorum]
MKELVFEIKDIKKQLDIWKNIFGGEIKGNSLETSIGTAKFYKFDFHDVLVLKAKTNEAWHIKRIQQNDSNLLLIRFSNTINFPEAMSSLNDLEEFGVENVKEANILFTNIDNEYLLSEPTIFQNVVIRIQKDQIFRFIPKDHPLQEVFTSNKRFYWYESFSPSILRLHKQILLPSDNNPELINHNLIYGQSWEMLTLFMQKLIFRNAENYHEIDEKHIEKIQQAKNMLLNNLAKPISLEEISKSVGLGKTSLQKYFKIVYGLSMHKFFQKYRMNEARDMILSGKYNVSEAAINVGYIHFSYFAAEFKKHFGVYPSELRNNAKKR